MIAGIPSSRKMRPEDINIPLKDTEKNKNFNPNGVPIAVVKENEVLSSNKPVLEQAITSSPNISPNISSEADETPAASATPAAPTDVAPMGGGAIDPAALGLEDPKTPETPITPAASAA